MQTSTIIAAALAPSIGAAFWWLVMRPGKLLNDWAWKHLPDGKLRRTLLRRYL